MTDKAFSVDSVIALLRKAGNPATMESRAKRFGISAANSLGVSQQKLTALAREIGPNNALAVSLFDSQVYEARLLCSKIFNPDDLTEQLMERWVVSFDTWEICDSFCMGFFAKSAYARSKATEWSGRKEEFVKRAAFSIMASYGFAHKQAPNEVFEYFLELVERESCDSRHYVQKAMNWTLRNVGKRNRDLRESAITVATRLKALSDRNARWVGSDALRELDRPDCKMLDYPRAVYRG